MINLLINIKHYYCNYWRTVSYCLPCPSRFSCPVFHLSHFEQMEVVYIGRRVFLLLYHINTLKLMFFLVLPFKFTVSQVC